VAHLAKVIVTPKPVVNDPQGMTVRGGLEHLGFGEVRDVRVGKYIEIRLDVPTEEEARRRVEEMCRRLLANHVIEDFRFELSELGPQSDDHAPANGAGTDGELHDSPADREAEADSP
jgi:phosphoribosylformylglycinamidine synthase subunit PurS